MVYACAYFVYFLSLAWDFSGFDSVFSLTFPFSDSHGVMGFNLGWALDCQKVLDLSEVVSWNPQGIRMEMVFFEKPSIGGWRQENSSRDGEGILRNPSSVWFFDLGTSLGVITVWWGWRWFNLWTHMDAFWIGLSMRSHIHAWNMAKGWFAERNISFSHSYGRVLCRIPEPRQLLHMFNKS